MAGLTRILNDKMIKKPIWLFRMRLHSLTSSNQFWLQSQSSETQRNIPSATLPGFQCCDSFLIFFYKYALEFVTSESAINLLLVPSPNISFGSPNCLVRGQHFLALLKGCVLLSSLWKGHGKVFVSPDRSEYFLLCLEKFPVGSWGVTICYPFFM